MRVHRMLIVLSLIALILAGLPAQGLAQRAPTIEQYLRPGLPSELVAAKKADRIAWIAYEAGARNVYTAAPPEFRPVNLTRFAGDNGIDLTGLNISDDGTVVTFVRGHAPNRDGWVANPSSDPNGPERAVWAARTAGGGAWRLGLTTTPVLSPDGRFVAFAKDGQIYRLRVTRQPAVNAVDQGQKPFITAWGTNAGPVWSPDGTKLAFVTNRVDHSFIAVYDLASRTLRYLAPGVDRDSSPTWSPDSKRLAFIRRPGVPFGLQAQAGSGGIGNPSGPAAAALAGRGGMGQGRGGAGQGRGGQEAPPAQGSRATSPGLNMSAFRGGYSHSFWVADVATGEGREFWHAAPGENRFQMVNTIAWAGPNHVIFQAEPEEWIRYYSLPIEPAGTATPRELTPGEGMVEFVSLAPDGRTLYYGTNASDIERRDIWKVPTAGGPAVQITKGDEVETYPAVLASGKHVAVLSATWRRPQSVAIVPADGSSLRVIYPTLPADFPAAAHVQPELVNVKAPDGVLVRNQVFVPPDVKPGERRPAIVFVHGGPVRQMVPAYHYRFFYHMAYGVNQYLAHRGYVVISVNYRSGIGYGKSFRTAPNTGARGNAEYQDVLAATTYLQGRPDVDPQRIGIWGLSYGGLLTAQALARNSDIFKVGVDMAGVHLFGNSLDPESVSYQSSAISQIANWKSPVLLIHGDDDRNVAFTQTTGLVQLLRAHDVPHELIVYPDDVHDPLLHSRWLYSFERTAEFLGRYLQPPPAPAPDGSR